MSARPASVEVEAPEPYCVACGCTHWSPCETNVGPCSWTVRPGGGRGMCSACAIHYANPDAVVQAIRELLTRLRRRPPFPSHGKPRKQVRR